jgi:hypothetical protein
MANKITSNSLLVRETKQLMSDSHYCTVEHFQDGTINISVTSLEDELIQEMSMDHEYAGVISNSLLRFWNDVSGGEN